MSAYPYNPENDKPECIVRNEHHDIEVYYNKYKCIIPKYAPFFKSSMVVKDASNNQILLEGVDFYFGHKFVEATDVVGEPIFGSIFMIDTEFDSDIIFDEYSTIGGQYNISEGTILNYLATDFDDPRNCQWTDVTKHEAYVPPAKVPEDFEDAVKTDKVTGALDEIRKAIEAASVELDNSYSELLSKVTALRAQVTAWEIETHPSDTDNVHDVTNVQIGAVSLMGDAANALNAYGRSLASLTDIVNKLGITQEHLDKYALLSGFTMTGDLVLGNSTKIVNHNGRSYIDIENGNINVIIDKSVTIQADSGKKADGRAVMIEGGCNYLAMGSTGVIMDNRTLVYNGHFLVTAGNIKDFLPTITPGAMRMRTANTEHVELYGDGTEFNPLIGMVTFPIATDTKKGMMQVTTSLTMSVNNIALSSKATFSLNNMIKNKLRTTQTINGIPLSSDISLSKATFNLNNVVNVSDEFMPNSDDFDAALDNKSNVGHKHSYDDLDNVENATTSIKGIFRLLTDFTCQSKSDAASPAMYGKCKTDVDISNAAINGGMPIDALEFYGLGDITGYQVNSTDKTITFPQIAVVQFGRAFYIPKTTKSITECQTHAQFIANRTLYFGVFHDGRDYKYVYGCEPLNPSRWSGLITFGTLKFTDTTSYIVSEAKLDNVLALPVDNKFTAHVSNRNSHGLSNGRVTLLSVGMDNIEPDYAQTATSVSQVTAGSSFKGLVPASIAVQALTGSSETVLPLIFEGEVLNPSNTSIPMPAGVNVGRNAAVIPYLKSFRNSGGDELASTLVMDMSMYTNPPVIRKAYVEFEDGNCAGIAPNGTKVGDVVIGYTVILFE